MSRAFACTGLSVLVVLTGCASNPAPAERDPRPRCQIHEQVLGEKTVPVSYGLIDDFYAEQRFERFPHVAEAFGGCIVPARRETRRVSVCGDCEGARREFERNYSAEWAAHLAAEDENEREFGETLAEEDREAERADERPEDRSAGIPLGDWKSPASSE